MLLGEEIKQGKNDVCRLSNKHEGIIKTEREEKVEIEEKAEEKNNQYIHWHGSETKER